MTDDDRQLAADLDQLIESGYPSAKAFLKDVKPHWDGKEAALSKIRSAKLTMPERLKRWLRLKVPFGTIYVEEQRNGSRLLRLLNLALKDKDYQAVIDGATEFIGAHGAGRLRAEGPEFLPKLYAYRAVGASGLGSIVDTVRDYKKAAEIARAVAPHLCPRYEVGAIAWESDRTNKSFKGGKVTKTFWRQHLRNMVDQLKGIKTSEAEDEKARLQALLRNGSRLDDRPLFDHWLWEARKHRSFGVTPEKRDANIAKWMSEKNDEDGDFKNARSYASFTSLFIPKRRSAMKKVLLSAFAAVCVWAAVASGPSTVETASENQGYPVLVAKAESGI